MSEYSIIYLHNHSKRSYEYNEEPNRATLEVENILQYYRQLAETTYKKVAFSITDHDSCMGSVDAMCLIQKNPEKYQNITFVPGMEINVSLDHVIKYPDPRHNDEKYVFKKMHLLVHAKKGRAKEFFDCAIDYSKLSHMQLKKGANAVYDPKIHPKTNELNSYIPIGKQILASRNILCDKYNIRIPFSVYKNCTKAGLTYIQIRDTFINETYNYLTKNTKIFQNYTKQQAFAEMDTSISSRYNAADRRNDDIFPQQKLFRQESTMALARFDIRDLNETFGDCATFCYAHPDTISVRKDMQIPVKAFENIDLFFLSNNAQQMINNKLKNKQELEHGFIDARNIEALDSNFHFKDFKFQLLHANLKKMGINIEGCSVTLHDVKDFTKLSNKLDTLMDKNKLYINFETDKHFSEKDLFYVDGSAMTRFSQNYLSEYKTRNIENPYLKYNRNGKVKEEENSITFQLVK